MTLLELLGAKEADLTSGLFGATTIKAVEALLVSKNNKTYLKCQIRNKEIMAKPEELVRQLWLHRLMDHYKYPKERITVEYPVTFGRDSSKRAVEIAIEEGETAALAYAKSIETMALL